MNIKKLFKSIFIFTLTVFSAVLLVSCGNVNKQKFPKGSIKNDVYLKAGDYKVTNEELYSLFRIKHILKADEILDDRITDIILEDYIKDLDITKDQEFFDDLLNKRIYGVEEKEQLIKFFGANEKEKLRKIIPFVDEIYQIDKSINKNELVDELLKNKTFDKYQNEKLIKINRGILAKRAYAKTVLEKDLKDKKSDVYVDDDSILTEYKKQIKEYPIKFFEVAFLSSLELKMALARCSIKIDTKGDWYIVPDIRKSTDEARKFKQTDSKYGYLKNIIEDDKKSALYDIYQSIENNEDLTEEQYRRYIEKYRIDSSRDKKYASDKKLENKQVLEQLVNLHNLFVDSNDKLKIDNGKIVDSKNKELDNLVKEYDDIKDTSKRDYLYGASIKADGDRPYSTKGNEYSGFFYLFYKLEDRKPDTSKILEGKDEKAKFKDTTEANEVKDRIRDELGKKKLTDEYISKQFEKLAEKAKIEIFDPIIKTRYQHKRQNIKVGKKGYLDKDTLAICKDIKITVDEIFKTFLDRYGVTFGTTILYNKIVRKNYEKNITKDDKKAMEKQLETALSYFSQGLYGMYMGIPANLGRDKFYILGLESYNRNDFINNQSMNVKALEYFKKDYTTHYDNNVENFEKLAKIKYDILKNKKGINISHLLIYSDLDFDGKPDNPNEIEDNKRNELEVLIAELINVVNERADKDTKKINGKERTREEKLENIAKNFQDTTRFTSSDQDTNEYYYAKFRRAGLNLKFEKLSTVDYTSNFPGSKARFDEAFYKRAIHILNKINDDNIDLKEGNYQDNGNVDEIRSSFGYHIILANSLSEIESAKVEKEKLSTITDKDGKLLGRKNENDFVNKNQIMIYIGESLDKDHKINDTAKKALEQQFSDIWNIYQSEDMNTILMLNTVVKNGLEFTNKDDEKTFNEFIEFSKQKVHNYLLDDKIGDDYYKKLYSTWWDLFK